MRFETFRARDLSSVARYAEATLGGDAIVLQTRTVRDNGEQVVEVVAAAAADVDAFRERLSARPLPQRAQRHNGRPYVIAVVGPTGAGKTTTIAKLAASGHAFGAWSVGLITLDTYRVADSSRSRPTPKLPAVRWRLRMTRRMPPAPSSRSADATCC